MTLWSNISSPKRYQCQTHLLNERKTQISALTLSPNPEQTRLAIANELGQVYLWDIYPSTSKPLCEMHQIAILEQGDVGISSMAFSPNGQLLAIATDENTVKLWDTHQPNHEPLTLSGHTDEILSVIFSRLKIIYFPVHYLFFKNTLNLN